ncbi:MAG: type II toxin-antitoxin system HicB family antitoxin [Dehalococcoidia bacterium]
MAEAHFTAIIEPDEGGFHAFVPALPGCHTFGATVEEAQANLQEAVELHLEAMLADGEEIPFTREPLLVTQVNVPLAS